MGRKNRKIGRSGVGGPKSAPSAPPMPEAYRPLVDKLRNATSMVTLDSPALNVQPGGVA